MHLIFVCKYRKKLLIQFGEEIKDIFTNIAKEINITIIEINVDKDHIHILIKYDPTESVVSIVRSFKQISTFRIWRQNNNNSILNKYFLKERTFWSDGYFACSIGNVSIDIIKKYIEEQG